MIFNWQKLITSLPTIAINYVVNKFGPESELVRDILSASDVEDQILDLLRENGLLTQLPNAEANVEEEFERLFIVSLTRGLISLAYDTRDLLDVTPENLKEALNLNPSTNSESFEITAGFFSDPTTLPGYQMFRTEFQIWCAIAYGTSKQNATNIALRLDNHFRESLYQEWLQNFTAYENLNNYVPANPFADHKRQRLSWQRYHAGIVKGLEHGVYGEIFSVTQVYVPLRAYWEEFRKRKLDGTECAIRYVVELDQYLNTWLNSDPQLWQERMCVLSAGPGAGKSTVARTLAASVIQNGLNHETRQVAFVPLKDLSTRLPLELAICEYMSEKEQLNFDTTLRFDKLFKDGTLIILDGVDELAIHGTRYREDVVDFIRELEALLQNNKVYVILTGRESILATQTMLNRTFAKSVLNLLPFNLDSNSTVIQEIEEIETKSRPDQIYWLTETSLFHRDDRNRWWRQYGKLTDAAYEGLPEEISEIETLAELTGQPLLSLLLAQFHLQLKKQGKKLNIDTNINTVYSGLIDRVHERQEKKALLSGTNQSREDLDAYLQVCAMAIWHSSGRTASTEQIQTAIVQSKLEYLIEDQGDALRTAIPRMMANFYFRGQQSTTTGATFEFTHKTFGEYLVARKLFRVLDTMLDEWSEKPLKLTARVIESALTKWTSFARHNSLDADLLDFINREAMLHPFEKVVAFQEMLAKLLMVVVSNGSPVQLKEWENSMTVGVVVSQTRNAEEALLAAHSACARVTKKVVINPDSHRDFGWGSWLIRISGSRLGKGILQYSMGWLDLKHADFYAADLQEFFFGGSDLSAANLSQANLYKASLVGVNLTSAILSGAQLIEANLVGVDLSEADLAEANLSEAYLEKIDFRRTNLQGANLSEADLEGANLSGINIEGIYLRFANLKGANLEGAILKRAYLGGANCIATNFSKANLTDANLTGADLTDVDLTNANLKGADLTKVELVRANLKGADIRWVDFRWANLTNVNLAETDVELYDTASVIGISQNSLPQENVKAARWRNLYRIQIGREFRRLWV
jgi:uncharacterized protein YjbI with pentapeptide repeats